MIYISLFSPFRNKIQLFTWFLLLENKLNYNGKNFCQNRSLDLTEKEQIRGEFVCQNPENNAKHLFPAPKVQISKQKKLCFSLCPPVFYCLFCVCSDTWQVFFFSVLSEMEQLGSEPETYQIMKTIEKSIIENDNVDLEQYLLFWEHVCKWVTQMF